jgi:hypothetical protein
MAQALRGQLLIVGVSAVWSCLVLAGIKWISDYKTAPGAQESAPLEWPPQSGLSSQAGHSTLVMFVHPKCPCSRASLSELDTIINADRSDASAFVVFLRPEGVTNDWEHTDTWETAVHIPRTTTVVDPGGLEAKRFGALTSGHVVLYDEGGRLRFSGGITGSRAHAGDNVGRQTVLDLLARVPTPWHDHAVFGCPVDAPPPASIARSDLP